MRDRGLQNIGAWYCATWRGLVASTRDAREPAVTQPCHARSAMQRRARPAQGERRRWRNRKQSLQIRASGVRVSTNQRSRLPLCERTTASWPRTMSNRPRRPPGRPRADGARSFGSSDPVAAVMAAPPKFGSTSPLLMQTCAVMSQLSAGGSGNTSTSRGSRTRSRRARGSVRAESLQ